MWMQEVIYVFGGDVVVDRDGGGVRREVLRKIQGLVIDLLLEGRKKVVFDFVVQIDNYVIY